MYGSSLYHNHALHRSIKGDFRLFEISVWLHSIGRSVVGLFIPIFLLHLGFSLPEVILYYVILQAFNLPLNFVAERSVERIGARRTIMISTVAVIAFFAFFSMAPQESWPLLILLAFLDAIYDAFYWTGHIYLFLRSSHSRYSTGEETGILSGVRIFGSMLGPLAGGLILIFGSETAVIAVSIFFLLLSLLPLARLRHIEDYPGRQRMPIRKFLDQPQARKDYWSTFLNSMNRATEAVIWPIFVFLAVGGTISVAYMAIVLSLSRIAFSYFTGTARRSRRAWFIMGGALMIGFLWLLRLLIVGPAFAYASTVLVGFFALLVDIPLDSSIFERGRQSDALRASSLRNTFSMAGMLLLFLIAYVMVDIFKVSFTTSALSMFLLVLVTYIFVGGHSGKRD